MAEAKIDSTRGELLAEAFKTYIAEAGGHRALAKDRIRADIVSGRVSVSGENRDGAPFEPPIECPWRKAAYDLGRSTARWLIGPEPAYANPLAGKAPPADTRRKVVAYAVRVTPTQSEAAPKNLGGSPGVWNWPDLAAKLPGVVKRNPFEDKSAFLEWCTNNVLRTDGKPREAGPDTKTVKAAIAKHRIDQTPDLFK
jgi:hypothetical protein